MTRVPVPGRILRIGGVPTHVLREGEGPVCVLSGGAGSCWFDWDAVVPLLAPHRTVIRFDRPGLGLSAPPVDLPSARGEAARILAVLDALGLGDPCTIVGHSLAALHAEAFARLYPGRTVRLVLIDGSSIAGPHGDDPREPLAPGLRIAAGRLLGAGLAAAGLPRALGRTVRRLAVRAGTVRHRDPAAQACVNHCYGTSRMLRAGLLEQACAPMLAAEVAALRARHPLPRIPVTVLMAYGARDSPYELHRLARARRLAAALDGADFRISAPAGPLLMLDDPAAVARAVLAHDRGPTRLG